jgi:hypothetical protein
MPTSTGGSRITPIQTFPTISSDFCGCTMAFSLHPDEYTPQGAVRLFPIREIESASRRLYGRRRFDGISNAWLAITDHPDSKRYLILDTATGDYLDVNPIVLDETEVVATNVEAMLDWVIRVAQKWIG